VADPDDGRGPSMGVRRCDNPNWIQKVMDADKKKRIEAQWRELLKRANQPQDESPADKNFLPGPKVIRRRAGKPDLQIA
jgi:hypothetical protein